MEILSHVLVWAPWVVAIFFFVLTRAVVVAVAGWFLFSLITSPPAILLGYVAGKHFYTNDVPTTGKWGTKSTGLVWGSINLTAAIGFLFLFPLSDPFQAMSQNESSALGSLRSISVAADGYKSMHPELGFPQNLSDLSSSRGASWQLDPQIASGEKSGYRFAYFPNSRTKNGRVESYELFADPKIEGTTGRRHFYVDQTGIFRYTTRTRADAQSPELLP